MRNLKRDIRKFIREPGYALGVLGKRLSSKFSYHFLNGSSSYPETISLFLTFNCNLRCNMCGYWGACGATKLKSPDFLSAELSLDELKKVIDEVSNFRPNITLFGGEPLLYKDWASLVRYAKEKNLRCNVVTNATFLEGKGKQAIESGIDEIIFSLEGPRDIHDKITNVKGSFDKAIAGLKEINEYKKAQGLKKPYINIASTISQDNFSFLEEIVEIGLSINADSITFHHLCFINADTLKRHNEIFKEYFGIESGDWSGFIRNKLPNIDVNYLIAIIKRLQNMKTPLDVSFYPNFTDRETRSYYTDFEFKPSSYRRSCLSPWMSAYIFPDGSVRPCEEIDFSCGNIKENSFSQIWNSEIYRNFRKVIRKIKLFPVCSKCTELYRF